MKKILLFSIIMSSVVLSACTTSNMPTATQQPQAKQSGEVMEVPSNWLKYENSTMGISVAHPQDFEVAQNGDYSVQVLKKINSTEPVGQGPASFVYISVVTPDSIELNGQVYNYYKDELTRLRAIQPGETGSKDTDDVPAALKQYGMYTRLPDTQIAGQPTLVFRNDKPWEFPAETSETRFVFEQDQNLYLLGYYTGELNEEQLKPYSIDQTTAEQIVRSVKIN